MDPTPSNRIQSLWQRLSFWEAAGLVILVAYAVLWGLRSLFPGRFQSSFFEFLAVLAFGYFVIRVFLWAREHLLWSLRNRLVTAYIFIAVVPVLLLLTMAGLGAYLLYWQLGSYVLYTDMQERTERLSEVAATMATAYALEAASGHQAAALALPEDQPTYLRAAMEELPGLKIDTGRGQNLLRGPDGSTLKNFSGLVLRRDVLTLRAVVVRTTPSGPLTVSASVPVTPEFVETLVPELGPIEFDVLRPTKGNLPEGLVVINRQGYSRVQQIATRKRSIPPAVNPFDKLITGLVSLEMLDPDSQPSDAEPSRLFASFSTRPSLLNRRLFSPLGELGGIAATALLVVGAVFLVIEIASLLTGIVLTRTITSAVGDLYSATQHVQAGDLSYRVRVPHRDQLAALGDSFNSMMQSVSTLIEEQRERHRLENELSIAHEVQQQLFPHALPKLTGVELEAVCRPARVVSGDYYDFIRISPTHLGIALADISGKGISAALLMASLQAALRSDVLRYRDGQPGYHPPELNTAEIVSHLNRHLFRNTSDERYATVFFGVYDTETRRLKYTNAGHLPPIYISGGRVGRLETGGMVVGLFSDVRFEQGEIEIESGGLLIAFSDGLIEPENVYGEEFGTDRLIRLAQEHQDDSPQAIASALMRAAEEWSGSPEQADDMTVVVARFSAAQEQKA
jgi:sigma-B regulation protein RsbU (phosphoserine phosphatase)